MSLTTCRACGQPLAAAVDVCGTCGVRIPEPVGATATEGAAGSDAGRPHPEPAASAAPHGAERVRVSEPVQTDGASAPPVATPEEQARFVQQTYDQLAAVPYVQPKRRGATPLQKIAVTVVVALLASVLARVGVGAIQPDAPDTGELVAQLPVDAEGGSMKFGDGGKITVPKKAVDRPRTINVYRRTVDQRVTLVSPTGGAPLVYPPGTLIVYTFGPVGLVFLRPVTIMLPIPPGQNGVVFVAANGEIRFLPGIGTGRQAMLRVTSLNFGTPGAITVVS